MPIFLFLAQPDISIQLRVLADIDKQLFRVLPSLKGKMARLH
jgi:hypothetical protein